MSVLKQGRQSSGELRPPKYCLDLVTARKNLLVAERVLRHDPVGGLPFHGS
jgi:hypothetical protein